METKNTEWRKESLLSTWHWDNWVFTYKIIKLGAYIISITKITLNHETPKGKTKKAIKKKGRRNMWILRP